MQLVAKIGILIKGMENIKGNMIFLKKESWGEIQKLQVKQSIWANSFCERQIIKYTEEQYPLRKGVLSH